MLLYISTKHNPCLSIVASLSSGTYVFLFFLLQEIEFILSNLVRLSFNQHFNTDSLLYKWPFCGDAHTHTGTRAHTHTHTLFVGHFVEKTERKKRHFKA